MIVWEVKAGKATLKFKSEAVANLVRDAINAGGLYDEPATVTDSRGPRQPTPKTKATVKKSKK